MGWPGPAGGAGAWPSTVLACGAARGAVLERLCVEALTAGRSLEMIKDLLDE